MQKETKLLSVRNESINAIREFEGETGQTDKQTYDIWRAARDGSCDKMSMER